MNEEVLPDVEAVARRAAHVMAECARQAVAARGRFLLALSGGSTPRRTMRALADERVPWAYVHLFQVDVHLGLGADGHTASRFPDDVSTECDDADIVVTAPYAGSRRLTMTYAVINRAHAIVWVVTGSTKGPALARLRAGDPRIPAGRIRRHSALVITGEAADAAARATA